MLDASLIESNRDVTYKTLPMHSTTADKQFCLVFFDKNQTENDQHNEFIFISNSERKINRISARIEHMKLITSRVQNTIYLI